jgi:Ca-activated chloride channel homolog
MTFLWPVMLLAVALVPLGVLAASRIDARRRARAAGVSGTFGLSTTSGARGRPAAARLGAALVVLALLVLAFALARPQAAVATPRLEGTLMLTFDVSGSMAATDVEPSRMEVAKAAARAIAERRPPGVVIGVTAFSNAGLAVQTPTDDTARVIAAIGRMTPAQGTSLGDGILSTLDAIEASRADVPADYYSSRSPAPTAPPTVEPGGDPATIIVLFTDGENTADSDPMAAADEAAARGIRIVTLGVGTTAGATLDLDGFTVQSRLDEAMLQAIADDTAGTYRPATDPAAAEAVYDALERRVVVRSEPIELTAAFAALGLVLLLTGAVLSLASTGRLP